MVRDAWLDRSTTIPGLIRQLDERAKPQVASRPSSVSTDKKLGNTQNCLLTPKSGKSSRLKASPAVATDVKIMNPQPR